jgi:hypothetical protein
MKEVFLNIILGALMGLGFVLVVYFVGFIGGNV